MMCTERPDVRHGWGMVCLFLFQSMAFPTVLGNFAGVSSGHAILFSKRFSLPCMCPTRSSSPLMCGCQQRRGHDVSSGAHMNSVTR